MDIIVTVKDEISQWEERYSGEQEGTWDTLEEAEQWFLAVLANYNSTLRPKELSREMVGIRVGANKDKPRTPHNWVKTNLITKSERGRMFDTYRCTECRITGKRPGLGSVIRDPKWKAKKYEWCSPPSSSCLA
jgi:hypothetical protein